MKNVLFPLTFLALLFSPGCIGHNHNIGAGTVTATFTYHEKVTSPEGAILEAELLDLSMADTPANVINRSSTPLSGPPPYTVTLSSPNTDETHLYAVVGRIKVNNRTRFTTQSAVTVLTQCNPSEAEVLLVAAPRNSAP